MRGGKGGRGCWGGALRDVMEVLTGGCAVFLLDTLVER